MTLVADGVSAGYGTVTVLRGVSLSVAEGEILGVLGRNGMGKTTLIRCLAGVIAPSAGTSRWRARTLLGCRPTSAPGAASPRWCRAAASSRA